MVPDHKDTLQLPRTDFPMRANLSTREPERIRHWEKLGVAKRRLQRNAKGPTFVLHDGPPFTNGDVHLGTALNKILKDTILRFRAMRGDRAPYVPGWDCHGLPIEFKVARQLQAEGKALDPLSVREACTSFSQAFIETQREQFKRVGIHTDWSREYRTMDPAYEAEILRTFAAFVEQGLVYRSHKPVFWSIPCQTALSEAEIEYQEHTSDSVWVTFPLESGSASKLGLPADRTSIVIWTTTPWTLPANLAVAVHPELDYVALQHGDEVVLVAAARAAALREVATGLGTESLGQWKGAALEGLTARHPFIDRASPIVGADYVTTESGSGAVHTAPGHGLEDYHTGLKHGLEVYCPVSDDGRFSDDGRVPAELVGLPILGDKGRSPANAGVLALLRARGRLLHHAPYRHSYPYCWRSKTPVAYRALPQWFVSLDHGGQRQKVLDAIGQVRWVPAWGENRIRGAVASRPDWCISRQRAWGVPIPAFYHKDGTSWLTADLVRHIAGVIGTRGSDAWWRLSPAELLGDYPLPEGWSMDDVRTEKDTLDVWFDSGSSHRAVLQHHPDLHWPADLYLEGSDQHRGWFQSSLWTALVADGAPPFRSVITHGFIVDLDGAKISKSGDKPMTADSFVKEWGADIVRLFVCAEDYRNDITLSKEIFGHIAGSYRQLRNTLRFQLSNLYDFNAEADALAYSDLRPVDKWALREAARFLRDITTAYEAYEFHRVYQAVNRFSSVTLSAIYHDLLKDRLYTWAPASSGRRSAQSVLDRIFDLFVRALAPVLAFTADEAWSFARGAEFGDDSVHLTDWPTTPPEWEQDADAADIELLLTLRDSLHEALESLRQAKTIGQSLDAEATFTTDPASPLGQALRRLAPELPELYLVSAVTLIDGPSDAAPAVSVQPAPGVRCPRCRRIVPALVDHDSAGEVCERCAGALNSL